MSTTPEKPEVRFLKPRMLPDGKPATVRDPKTKRRLPPEGESKPWDVFWRRRVAEGGAIICEEPKPEAPKLAPRAAPKKSRESEDPSTK